MRRGSNTSHAPFWDYLWMADYSGVDAMFVNTSPFIVPKPAASPRTGLVASCFCEFNFRIPRHHEVVARDLVARFDQLPLIAQNLTSDGVLTPFRAVTVQLPVDLREKPKRGTLPQRA
jgi:hypothetical protein